jgi:outer membrane protein assembly factor BamB
MTTLLSGDTRSKKRRHSSPIVDEEGNVYVGTDDLLSSYTPSGSLRWAFRTKANIVPAPSIFAEDGSPTQLYFGDEAGDYYVLWGNNGTVYENLQLPSPASTFTHVRDHASVQGMQTAYFGDAEGFFLRRR